MKYILPLLLIMSLSHSGLNAQNRTERTKPNMYSVVAAGTVDVTNSPTKISLEWPLENYYVSITSIGKAAQVFVSDKSEEGFFVNAATEQTVRIDYIVYAKSENIKKAILKRKSLNTYKQHP